MSPRLALFALSLLAVPALAHADIPPPRHYVEKCTIKRQCKKHEVGDACRASFEDENRCATLHKDDGYEFRCRTSGASVWTEVWCAPKPKRPPIKPATPAKPPKAKPAKASEK